MAQNSAHKEATPGAHDEADRDARFLNDGVRTASPRNPCPAPPCPSKGKRTAESSKMEEKKMNCRRSTERDQDPDSNKTKAGEVGGRAGMSGTIYI